MDLLEIPKAIVCGLSMGGYILLNAVKRYPGRFIAIALSDTQCVADTTEVKAKRKNSILKLNEGGIEEFIEGFIKNIFCDATKVNSKEVIGEVKKMMQSTSLSTLTGTLDALAQREETCTYLQEISIPALIICGKEDIVTPPVQSEFMNLHIINSVLKIIDKAGHMSNLEQAEAFNTHLNDFFNGLK